MNQDATLAQMRELKLIGMAQAFEALCLLPIDKQPASQQLLTQLLEAEELYRKNRKTMAGIKLAQFRYQASLEEITLSPERNLSKDLFHRLTDLSFAKKAENILITGATGCGKSFIATALGYQACQMGLRVGYFSLPKLLQRLHLAKADGDRRSVPTSKNWFASKKCKLLFWTTGATDARIATIRFLFKRGNYADY